jgi:hypothetical protein
MLEKNGLRRVLCDSETGEPIPHILRILRLSVKACGATFQKIVFASDRPSSGTFKRYGRRQQQVQPPSRQRWEAQNQDCSHSHDTHMRLPSSHSHDCGQECMQHAAHKGSSLRF